MSSTGLSSRSRTRFLLATLLVCSILPVVGCSSPGNVQGDPKPDVDAQVVDSSETHVASGDTVIFRRLSPGEAPCTAPEDCNLPATSVSVKEGTIRVTEGLFTAPYGVETLNGHIEKKKDQITVRISPPEGGVARAVLTPFAYEVNVPGLTPGTYRFRLVHRRDAMRTRTEDAERRAVVVNQKVAVD